MLGRVFRIYQRYAMRHLRLASHEVQHFGAPTDDGATRVDRIYLDDNRLVVEGWSAAARVGLELGRARVFTTPNLGSPEDPASGFELRIPFQRAALQLLIETDGQSAAHPLPQFSALQLAAGRLVMGARFVAVLFASLPDIWRWKVRGDLGRRECVKERLGLVTTSEAVPLDRALLRPEPVPEPAPEPAPKPIPEPQAPEQAVTILLPVYNAFELLPETLDRIFQHTDLPFWLIVIEDGSPDPRVRPFLQSRCASAQAEGHDVLLIEQPENTGFIGAVNAGLGRAMERDAPVVLLNSDAMVPAGWASRLLAPLAADRSVASVTPFSNDAEIFSVPVICQKSPLGAGQVDALDAQAQRVSPGAGLVDCPTGVGFCMALSMRFLKEIGLLDPVFGRGYGEETDWCQRARAKGGRHVCAADLFVEHRGAASFGTEAKRALLEKNHGVIQGRYPQYDLEVQGFLRADPLGGARLAHALAWLAVTQGDAPVPLYLAHAMGGGAEDYLQQRIAADLTGGAGGGAGDTAGDTAGGAIVLRVGTGHRWRLEVHSAYGTVLGTVQGVSNDTDFILRLLSAVPRRRVIYSCGVGDNDPVFLPELLCQLAGGAGSELDILFHDFFPLSPSYVLLNQAGVFEGVPEAGSSDPAHQSTRPGGWAVSLADWRAAWGQAMARAETLTVFSQDSRALVAQAYPEAAAKIRVVPHSIRDIPEIPQSHPGAPVIGVLGNIGFHKGAEVLKALSQHLAKTPIARLVVVGNIDPAYRLASPALVHGAYRVDELPQIAAQYEIDRWFIPSIWPETFSFTTHEALRTGLPVYSFDLGAQAEAVRAALAQGGQGAVIDLSDRGAEPLVQHLAQNPAQNLAR